MLKNQDLMMYIKKHSKYSYCSDYKWYRISTKDCVGLYTKANSQLKAKIDVIEDGLKLEKENSVKEYFEELVTAKKIDFISFERLGLKITLSVSEKS